jgi:hypothetical protein
MPTTILSTTDQKPTTDARFLASGDKVRFFFQAGAFEGEGRLRQPKALSINSAAWPADNWLQRTPAATARGFARAGR